MKKTNLLTRSFLLSISLLLFASDNYITTTIAQDKIPPSIILRTSRTQVTLPCPLGIESSECCGKEFMSINLISEIKNPPDGSIWSYRYEVSGGRVVGSGAKVSLDLSGVRPGTYTVTVYATTYQKKKPREVIISDTAIITSSVCPYCHKPIISDVCRKISVEPSENSIKSGATLIFIGTIESGNASNTYNWTVSAGSIVKGQGTPIIYVDTSGLGGQELTATLEMGGGMIDCNKTASSTVRIIK